MESTVHGSSMRDDGEDGHDVGNKQGREGCDDEEGVAHGEMRNVEPDEHIGE